MPTFFFDFMYGSHTIRDEDGHACESVDAARAELIRTLPEVLLSDPQDVADREVACIVRDERDSILFRGSITLRVRDTADL